MNWQLSSLLIVIACLGAAFWWYERSRPQPKLLAVIATLAALSALLGRDAFAAIPDVKPITAMVLVTGIAFGAGPGFAVGAISALVSNVLLGQGPWTPWQMLGWGLVGLIGAGIGALGGRRMGPLGIALSCAAAAEAFNLVVDLYTWTATGSHTLAAFGVVIVSALPFDGTHVAASFGFGLLFGATLLRMLLRVRSRLQVTWRGSGASPGPAPGAGPAGSLVLAVLLVLVAVGASGARPADASPARAASSGLYDELYFLRGAQNHDGGFGPAAGQASGELYTAWAAIGLAAAGVDPATLSRGGGTVLDSLRRQAYTLSGAGDMERTILALHACGASVTRLGSVDPLADLLRHRSRDGSFEELGNLTAFGILALRAAGYGPQSPPVAAAARWLVRQQEGDGGFGYAGRGGGSDVDDTAASVQALGASGDGGSRSVRRAVAYLLASQNSDGGFPSQAPGPSNAQSSAWAVQGLIAAGRGARARAGGDAYLRRLVASNGSIRYSAYSRQTPVWVTAQAIAALAGAPLPVG